MQATEDANVNMEHERPEVGKAGGGGVGPAHECLEPGMALAGEVGGPRPGTPLRLVKSARPVSPNEPVLDATVWTKQALKRPPSRQKRPPEALHLFEGAGMWKSAAAMKGRPQTAMGLACSHRAPLFATAQAVPLGVQRSGSVGCRPISRHRPPPESLDLTQQTRF